MVLTVAMSAAHTTRSTLPQWSRNSRASGMRGTVPSATSRSKAGVSSSLRRMTQPATATATLSQNGTRHPQLSNCSSGSAATGMNTNVARIWPNWVPLRVKLV